MNNRLMLAAMLVVALMLAACGGTPGGTGGTGTSPTEDAGTPDTGSPGPTDAGASPGDTGNGGDGGNAVAAIQDEGTLVCGVKYDVFAFGLLDPATNEVEGFDADLCREIATALDVEPEFVEAVSANRIPFLQEDQVDLIISTMTINDERRQEIDFSVPYYIAGQSLLVMADDESITSLDDLAGKTVCSAEGSTSEQNIRDMAPEAELSLFQTYTEAAQALVDGRCDAVSTDDVILFGLANQFEGTELRGEPFTTEEYGIGIKKGKEDLVEFVNGVLTDMGESGRWAELYQEHIAEFTGETPDPPFAE
ncbi:glutamine ABC transporter substrate-binding protein GlnH [soil metagenome]